MESIISLDSFIGATAIALYTIALGFMVGGIIKLRKTNSTIFTSAWMYLFGVIGLASLIGSEPVTSTQVVVAVLSLFFLLNGSLVTLFKMAKYERIRDAYSGRDS